MTDNYRGEPLHYMIVADQPHPLEEAIQGAAGDGDHDIVTKIFVDLYKEGRTEEIEYILSRFLFTVKGIEAALDHIKRESEAMEEDPDYAQSMTMTHST